MRCGSRTFLFSRKTVKYRKEILWETVAREADDETNTYGEPVRVFAAEQLLSHNAVFLCSSSNMSEIEGTGLVAYGGRDRHHLSGLAAFLRENELGISRVVGTIKGSLPFQWAAPKLVLAGDHTGCVELRRRLQRICEFDGRLTVVAYAGRSHTA